MRGECGHGFRDGCAVFGIGKCGAELRDERLERLGVGGGERGVEEAGGVCRRGTDDRGFRPVVCGFRENRDEMADRFVGQFEIAKRDDRFETDARVGVVEQFRDRRRDLDVRRQRDNFERVFTHCGVRVVQRDCERWGIEFAETRERPNGEHTGLRRFFRRDDLSERGRVAGFSRLDEKPERVVADVTVWMIERGNQLRARRFPREFRDRERFRLVVLHAPDAAEVVVAIRPHRRAGRAVLRAARVVVNHGLVVEIDDVKRAVGTDARLDRTPPVIFPLHELGFLAAFFLLRVERHAVGCRELVVHDVDRRLGGEVAAVPFFRPRATLVDRAPGGGGERTDLINLHVGLLIVVHQRICFLPDDVRLPARGVADFSAREDALRHDDMHEHLAAGRLSEEHLVVPGDVESPSIAALGTELLERRTVRLEAHHARAHVTKVLAAIGRFRMPGAVSERRVNPAVVAPAQIVDDRVRVAGAESGVEFRHGVRLAGALRVAEPEDVRRLRDDHAVLVKDHARREFEAFVKDVLFLENAVRVGIAEDRDFVGRGAVCDVAAFHEAARVFPRVGLWHAATVWILGRLGHPHAALPVPIDIHRLVDERLGRDERHFEIGMHHGFRGRFLRQTRPAIGITQRGEFLPRAEFVRVFPLRRPRDAAQQDRAEIGSREVHMQMAGDRDERAVAVFLIHPHLGLDVIDADFFPALGELLRPCAGLRVARRRVRRVGCGEHADVRREIHIVVNLVVHVEVRRVFRDRVFAVGKVERHRAFEPFGLALLPRAADERFIPVVRRLGVRHRRRVQDDETAAAFHKIVHRRLLRGCHVAAPVAVDDDHVGAGKLRVGGKFRRAVGLRAALIQQRQPVFQKRGMIVRARPVCLRSRENEHAQRRFRPRDDGGEKDAQQRDEEQFCFHGKMAEEGILCRKLPLRLVVCWTWW